MWLSCCSSWVNTTASSFLSLLTLIHPPLHRHKSSCWAPSFIFSPSSRPVSLFLFLIHLFPSDQKPVKHPVAFLCSRVSHESGRPSSHPRGHGGTLRFASLRIKHIKSSNGRFPSPPLPPSTEGWHFSHFTHHYIQPVFIAAHQRRRRKREEQEEAFLTSPHLFLFFIVLVFIFLTPHSSRWAKEESDDACVRVCVCVDTLCSAASGISSMFNFAFTSVSLMRFHTARFSLPEKVSWEWEKMIIILAHVQKGWI